MAEKRRKTERRGAANNGLSGQSSPPPAHSSPRTAPAAVSGEEASMPDDRQDEATSAAAQEEGQRVERDIGDLLADVARERDEYLELARRTKADFENYRKRVAGQASEAEKRGRAALARELLPVLDNLERALGTTAASPPTDERSNGMESSLAEGVRLVHEELKGILERAGVESYEPSGERFDPEWHEALMTRPGSSDQAGIVLEVVEKGYRLDGQVLRPARVVVGTAETLERGDEGEAS